MDILKENTNHKKYNFIKPILIREVTFSIFKYWTKVKFNMAASFQRSDTLFHFI